MKNKVHKVTTMNSSKLYCGNKRTANVLVTMRINDVTCIPCRRKLKLQ
jgi:hypothetical protein